jgi:bifunctional DNA-binding transcriptional regulator/antitoxin component of YhaV-PrlF toxin-antitoxin module
VIPSNLRKKHGIEGGTRVKFLEDQSRRIVLQPVTEQYIDRLMGCLAGGPDLLKEWEKDHRKEG